MTDEAASLPHSSLLSKMFDSSIDLVLFFKAIRDEDSCVIDFEGLFNNKASREFIGNIEGKSLSADQPFLHNWLFEKATQVVNSGIPDITEQIHHFSGYEGWFHHVTTKLDDGIMITSRDITSLKKNMTSVTQAQDFLQAVLDHSLDVIQVFDAVRDDSGDIIDFTWKVQNSKGYIQNGDVIGKSLLAQNAGVVPSGIYDRMIKVTETGIADEQEQFYSHEQFDEQWFYQALVKQGDGVLMTTRNITVEKKGEQKILQLKDELLQLSENKYRTLFNSMDQGYCIIEMMFDQNGKPCNWRYIEVNPAFEKHNGLHNATGKTILELTPDIEQKWMDIYGNVAITGESIRFEEDSDAFSRIFDLYCFRIGKPEEHKIAVLFTNVTAKRQAEKALLERELQLQELLRIREDFIGIASHELRTPVTSIQIFADLIEEQLKLQGNTSTLAMVVKLNAQLTRLIKLINDLLDTSKIKEGRIIYNTENININELITEQLEELQRTTSHKIILQLDTPAIVSIDRDRFAQVIVNLVSNAIKYSPQATPILVKSRVYEEKISISVQDNGIGIPASSIPFVFDRFYRATSDSMSTYPGIGLGLYIAAEIVKNHGGQLSVSSIEGKGSEFTCTLPLA